RPRGRATSDHRSTAPEVGHRPAPADGRPGRATAGRQRIRLAAPRGPRPPSGGRPGRAATRSAGGRAPAGLVELAAAARPGGGESPEGGRTPGRAGPAGCRRPTAAGPTDPAVTDPAVTDARPRADPPPLFRSRARRTVVGAHDRRPGGATASARSG